MNSPRSHRSPLAAPLAAVAAGLLAALAPAPAAPGAADEPGQSPEARTERHVVTVDEGTPRVIEIERRGDAGGHAIIVTGPGGEPVHVELEPDGEGGYHWVERGPEGEVVQVRPLDEIAEAGEPRVRAVFIGEEGTPIDVECASPEEGDCPRFRFDYRFVDPEGMAVHRGYLGAVITELTPELRAHFGASGDAGVLVARVEEESPAAAAGLAVGDLVTAVDGEPIATAFDLRRRVRALEQGQRVTVEVVRGGRVLALPVTIAEREVPEVDLRRFLWSTGDHPHGPDQPFIYHLDPERLNEAVIDLKERFAGPELRHDVIRLRGAESDLEARIAELEKRIEELEALLEEK